MYNFQETWKISYKIDMVCFRSGKKKIFVIQGHTQLLQPCGIQHQYSGTYINEQIYIQL